MGYMRCCDRCGKKVDSLSTGWYPIQLLKFKYRGELRREHPYTPFGEDKYDLCWDCLNDLYKFLEEKKRDNEED